jgi:hypothetical protein
VLFPVSSFGLFTLQDGKWNAHSDKAVLLGANCVRHSQKPVVKLLLNEHRIFSHLRVTKKNQLSSLCEMKLLHRKSTVVDVGVKIRADGQPYLICIS